MIGYVTLGSNEVARAAGFHDERLKLLGAGRYMEASGFCAAYFRDLDGNKFNCFCWKPT